MIVEIANKVIIVQKKQVRQEKEHPSSNNHQRNISVSLIKERDKEYDRRVSQATVIARETTVEKQIKRRQSCCKASFNVKDF